MSRTSARSLATIAALSAIAFLGVFSFVAGTAHAAAGFGTVQVDEVVSGGTANPSDFTVQLTRSVGGSSVTLSGQGNTITFNGLTPGVYQISETGGPSGYSTSFSGACDAQGNITVASSATLTCTITHVFGSVGSIKVTQVVSGGTAHTSDFTVHIVKSGAVDTGSPSGSGDSITFGQLTPGSYMVLQSSAPSGYTTSWGGACNAVGRVTVSANNTASCTVTYTVIPTTGGGGGGGSTGRTPRTPQPPRTGR